MSLDDDRIRELRTELANVEAQRERILSEIARIASTENNKPPAVIQTTPDQSSFAVNNHSKSHEKIALFRSLFRGRQDVFPRRFESMKTGKSGYQPVCENEWQPGICLKPRIKCSDCEHRRYVPLTDQVIEWHLRGCKPDEKSHKDFVIGVYPMLTDETSWFLAVDFDKATWEGDVLAFRQTCAELDIPVAIERSRSGNGAHAWFFFGEPVPCVHARKMGAYLLTETMERRPDIGLDSYDRFFPNQDTLPQGGLGNLIALPLQKKSRDAGNTVFLDENNYPYGDQWDFLSSIRRMSCNQVEKQSQIASEKGRVTGVRMPVDDEENNKPWESQPSRSKELKVTGPFPQKIEIVHANQVYLDKKILSPSLRNALIRIAAFQNPDFYQKQNSRMPVWNTPRIISCAENFPQHIALPRGCLLDLVELFKDLAIELNIRDERISGEPLKVEFTGNLFPEQQKAAQALLAHDTGVLAAATAFGKTIVATYLIAKRGVNTLILVHRRQLLQQWQTRLTEYLDLDKKDIGIIGGGKRKQTGKVDIAIIQSLNRKGEVDNLVAEYGHLVIDECHHISAPSFEAISREFKGRYVTGLSATVTRKDGHHPIIFMNCGPVRFKVSSKDQAKERPFGHSLIVRNTYSRLPVEYTDEKTLTIAEIYSFLMRDEQRNKMIINDILVNLNNGRFPVLLTERREHVEYFRKELSDKVDHLIAFQGGMGRKQLKAALEKLETLPDNAPRLILATGRFLGEGFDDARLDTLFLALPVSWKGILVQYSGRLHRFHENKKKAIIYDYADMEIPMLARMFEKRVKGYRSIGYEIEEKRYAEREKVI
ncbi:MAG: restriction endonuclease subunit R [Candidatus Glassbacteria bacterium RIFCSPLOWO2_12_FULL_58_11]|uniref:Restriction endonuclease subunit R n=1 Tax=Candidatus Glassbacteria bacterium RIFCSPLOWO2_12_FULL_58_11 TaxID=1817867 RepID=A0A1F5YY57_9BACT|nr:MAG: restriction endonuclease subunit R [Candidatus Glassbacteria bacterium RIFCSPLOWO2_12_FULL_58_11]